MTALRLVCSLPPDLQVLVQRLIAALLAVQRPLGSGMSEAIYAAAVRAELAASANREMRTFVSSCSS